MCFDSFYFYTILGGLSKGHQKFRTVTGTVLNVGGGFGA